jgi:hypothetical protein
MITAALLVVLFGVSGWTLYRLQVLQARVEVLAKLAVSADETMVEVHKLLVALDRDLRA